MLFLPAAALCCLCSALVTMAAQMIQEDLTLTRRVGESVSFSCGDDECDYTGLIWYQKKDTEPFRLVLVVDTDDGRVESSSNHSQKDDFSVEIKQNRYQLKIEKVKLEHSATYYCACWKDAPHSYDYDIFGSGTKLYVTDEQVVKPVVSVYPAASRAHLEGNSSLLCVASAMFPPLVQFSWKRQKKNGGEAEELPPAEGEQLELREAGRTIAIRMVDGSHSDTYKYSCWVKHEGGTVEAQTQQGNEGLQRTDISHCSSKHLTPFLYPPTDYLPSLPSIHEVKLLCLLYTVLIVKSLVYCCGLSLLMMLTNKGASTNCTHADCFLIGIFHTQISPHEQADI
ncbi:immunoglobulin lambda-1 light chain-like [Astatotilapia calliptera]|uniref:immunoglobulin lambda-1 light chain-like n=1 Tax=Astatotilapia calliptera TaxID=8154 RepID=UPI000E3FCF6A|nr:immunoglobulin lambda-1 light chain-like [Astatotilapia calliptera]